MILNSISAGLAVRARSITTTRHRIFRRACLWTGFLASATIAFGPPPAQAAVTEAWVQRYQSDAGSAAQVVTDAAGNVIVAGSAGDQTGSGLDTLIIKYSCSGVPVRTNRYKGPSYWDQATAVAVDDSGNVFVTGYSGFSFGGGNVEFATIAYSGTGVPLWTNRYNGLGNHNDEAKAVAVDGHGNVVVTGNSGGTDSNTADYYTAKYAASDGATLWEKRFNRPLIEGASPPCLALGPNGMIAVSGSSSGDYATVVYREVPAVAIDLVPTGFRLRFAGVPGRSYNLKRAPAVPGPWSTINTQTAPASGILEYLDANSPAAAAFYRTSEP